MWKYPGRRRKLFRTFNVTLLFVTNFIHPVFYHRFLTNCDVFVQVHLRHSTPTVIRPRLLGVLSWTDNLGLVMSVRQCIFLYTWLTIYVTPHSQLMMQCMQRYHCLLHWKQRPNCNQCSFWHGLMAVCQKYRSAYLQSCSQQGWGMRDMVRGQATVSSYRSLGSYSYTEYTCWVHASV